MTRFTGIYNADGTLLGEISYVAKKLAGRGSCALCDITHGWTGRKKSFDATCDAADIEWELLHRDEATPEQLAAAGELPAVIAYHGDKWELALGPRELDDCNGDPAALVARLVG
ncbi:MAG: hypothetical protein ACO3C5_10230 [Ilumatobacteraceae bacterium]